MSVSATAAPALTATLGASPRQWIQSRGFDLPLFILAPLLSLPLIFGILLGARHLLLLGFTLAFAHYLSTFTFFFWDENHARHRARWAAFFAGPVIIAVCYFVLVAYRSPLMAFLLLFWNTYHVARQSCGILSIYRHRAGVFDPEQKEIANAAVILTSTWCVLWNIETHRQVFPMLTSVGLDFPRFLRIGLGAVAAVSVLRLAASLRRRAAAGNGPGAAELTMIVMSLVFFHPYLWMRDSESATFAMLIPHYVQYLALIWLLHRRKFPQASGSLAQVALHKLSTNLPLLVGFLGAAGLAFLAAKVVLAAVGHIEVFEAAYLLLAFVHFYLDGLFWAFRDPHVRRSLGPYLMRGSSVELAAVAGVR